MTDKMTGAFDGATDRFIERIIHIPRFECRRDASATESAGTAPLFNTKIALQHNKALNPGRIAEPAQFLRRTPKTIDIIYLGTCRGWRDRHNLKRF